jgi:hypothetical protein
VSAQSGKFEPEKMPDEYAVAVKELVAARSSSGRPRSPSGRATRRRRRSSTSWLRSSRAWRRSDGRGTQARWQTIPEGRRPAYNGATPARTWACPPSPALGMDK